MRFFMQALKVKLLSPLAKVFLDEEPFADPCTQCSSVLKSELLSFQISVSLPIELGVSGQQVVCTVQSPLLPYLRLRLLEQVPVAMPSYPAHTDGDYLSQKSGLFPDLLLPIPKGGIHLMAGRWRTLWVDLDIPCDAAAGVFPIDFTFSDTQGNLLDTLHHEVTIIDQQLPPQKLLYTRWFYCDCLADYYQTEVFSEKHWQIIENFVAAAAKRGINMLLTPLFTPPLDTAIGEERPTVQLIGVTRENGSYSFDFSLLERWVTMAERCGIAYFEMSHFFTQWGATSAPKIMAAADGKYQRIFGWDTASDSPAYRGFLAAFLPCLTQELHRLGIAGQTYFHISDEPNEHHLELYLSHKKFLEQYIGEFPCFDALSNYAFYEKGAVACPVAATDHIEPFLEHEVKPLWAYYCCGQNVDVSNGFIAMPAQRTRILGIQLYKYAIDGFLQWGYNSYYSQLSMELINPFLYTHADGVFPGGDSFLVYPAPDGTPYESMRLMLFFHGLQDLRALQLLEKYKGREYVMQLVEEGLNVPVTFKQFPRSADYLLLLRNRVNRALAALPV